MKLWQDLVNSALFGTERRAWQASPGSTRVEALLQGIAAESPNDVVLRAAGILSVYRRTGEPPSKRAGATPAVCPAETLPPCGPGVAGHLVTMLNGSYRELLPAALAAIAETGQRLPDELLAAFLDLAQQRQNLRAPLFGVAGARGKWLAAQNPDWSWLTIEDVASAEDVQTVWETGSIGQRIGILRQLRKTARDQSIRLIESTWGQEKADQRTLLLETLRTGLAMDDEPFLEERLDDKSVVVRRAAADLLAELPQSRLSLRMHARLQPLLRLESKGLLRREALDVTLPENADTAMQRDGIRPQGSGGQAGAKASLVSQMLGMVPPSVWSKTFSRSPERLLAAAGAGDWKDLLWSAWMKAAERHRDREWILALSEAVPAEATPLHLLQFLPGQERDTVLCRAAENADDGALTLQIPRFPGPWSLQLTRIVIKRIRKAGDNERLSLCRITLVALPFLDPQAANDISEDWPREMADLAAALQFKNRLMRDIRNRC